MADIVYNNVPVLSQIKAKGKIYYLKDAEARVQLQEEANAREAAITQVLKDANAYTDEQIAKIEHIKYELVTELPEASETVEFNKSLTVYLVKDHSATKDVYCEYICVKQDAEYVWEKLGDSDIDFSKYYTKEEIDAKETSLKALITAEQTRAEGVEGGLDKRIKALEDAEVPAATEEKVGGIKIGHVEAEGEAAVKLDADGKAYVEATQYTAKENGGLQLEGTAFSIKEVSADLIVNGTNALIIDGGKLNGGSYTAASIGDGFFSQGALPSFTEGAFTAGTLPSIDTSKFYGGSVASLGEGFYTAGSAAKYTEGTLSAGSLPTTKSVTPTFTGDKFAFSGSEVNATVTLSKGSKTVEVDPKA